MKKIFTLVLAGSFGVGLTTLVWADDYKSITPPEGHPLDELISGYEFRSTETQMLQDDDFDNPAFLWVEQGDELWRTVDGAVGKSCADCHGAAAQSMKTAGAEFPKWNAALNKPLNLEQQINKCREDNMQAKAWKWESANLLSMTAYVRNQSKGVPVNVSIDGPMMKHYKNGEKLYHTRVGQLNMACSNCHADNYGNYIRSDLLSQGQSNGFPTYRLKWQKLGSLHRRFKGCIANIRGVPYAVGSDEFVDLELYVAYRGQGLPVEAPSVRN